MSVQNKALLKSYFNTGDVPTETNFIDLVDSMSPWTVAIMVAAYNASSKVKAHADYVCDGTADDVEIAAALAALPAVGGTVVLSEGAFSLAAELALPAKPTRLLGQGQFAGIAANTATILNFALGAGGDCVVFSNNTKGQEIGNFTIVGDDINTNRGVYIGANSAYKTLRNVLITGIVSSGVRFDSGSSQCYLERVYVKNSPGYGFDSFAVDNLYVGCQATRDAATGVGGLWGFKLAESGSTLISCVAEKHDRGFEVATYGEGITLLSCYGEKNNVHLRVGTVTPNEPVGTTIVGFHGIMANHATDAAVLIDDSYGTTLIGTHIKDSTSNKAIEVTSAAEAVKIIGGWTNDTTPIIDEGATNLKIEGFYPFIDENSGTDSIANTTTSKTITHGLSATPTVDNIQVTLAENPDNSPGAIWVDTITSTQFNVNCENDPGTSNLDFGWKASVY